MALPLLFESFTPCASSTNPWNKMSRNVALSKVITLVMSCEFHQPLIWSGPSISRSAGNIELNGSFFFGYPIAAHAARPESNHTSSTSGMRCICFSHLHLNVISSMYGLWRSCSFFGNSSTEPTILTSPHSHVHIGSGIPQYRWRDIGQSPKLCNQLSKRCPAHSGCHFTFLFSLMSLSLISVTLKNHCFTAISKRGDWQRQHSG